MSKILWLSDFDLNGSGYLNISVPLCNNLSNLGHEVKAVGLGYRGQEHDYKFSVIPASNFQDVSAIITNMHNKWQPEIFICALDIPHHEKLLGAMSSKPFKYIGIMALEAGPLCMSWAMALMAMDKVYIISEYGAEEARKVGVPAEHIQIGINTNDWKIPTVEEKKKFREILGISEDEFIVLTVADNQERKNPHKLLETYADFAKGKKTRYIFVTREFNPAGGRLKDYATELGIHQNMMWFERGMSQKQLWSLYAIADVFLLASKSEGLGMPLLEAMSVGVPIVATNCTAISELLADNRGLLVDYEYQHRDCFGNGWRYWFSKDNGVKKLNQVYEQGFDTAPAKQYIDARTWDISAKQLDEAIKELLK